MFQSSYETLVLSARRRAGEHEAVHSPGQYLLQEARVPCRLAGALFHALQLLLTSQVLEEPLPENSGDGRWLNGPYLDHGGTTFIA